jgi:hypothetical protein
MTDRERAIQALRELERRWDRDAIIEECAKVAAGIQTEYLDRQKLEMSDRQRRLCGARQLVAGQIVTGIRELKKKEKQNG